MKMDPPDALRPAEAPVAAPELFEQIGSMTRVLHDALQQLGVMPQLQNAAHDLPDTCSRLNYIATKTAEAAEKVLNSVDQAKIEHVAIRESTREVAAAIAADPAQAVAGGALLNFVRDIEARTDRIDAHLTDIMLAQDFHDLTGQVMARAIALAGQLEASLLKLLIQAVPPERRDKVDDYMLQGPVIAATGQTGVVAGQGEVDDLLASLGF
jgi:chemotaxis protein CheZ